MPCMTTVWLLLELIGYTLHWEGVVPIRLHSSSETAYNRGLSQLSFHVVLLTSGVALIFTDYMAHRICLCFKPRIVLF